MKAFITLLVCFTLASAWNVPRSLQERWVTDALPHYEACLTESGANIIRAVNILQRIEYPDDQKLKCFAKCLEVRMGLMLSNGTPIPEGWVQVVGGVTPEIAKQCTEETIYISDTCDKAYEWSKCLVKAVSTN